MKTILIADDQPLNQQLFSMIINKLGYHSIFADDGYKVLEQIRENDVDLIFMDIQMPKMNGSKAAEILRKSGFTKPIIAVTAEEKLQEQERFLTEGFNDVIIKPVKKTDAEEMIRKWLNASIEAGKDDEKPHVTIQKSGTFSAEVMLNNFMNNKEAALPLLSRFIERTKNQLENFRALIEAGDWATARQETHMIKGSAPTMGGSELGKAAAKLESACINNSLDEVEKAFPLLSEAFSLYKKEAENYIHSQG